MDAAFQALCKKHPDRFRLFGDVYLERCPVCLGTDHLPIWQLPQTKLTARTFLSSPGAAYDNTYISSLPMLTTPQDIYVFHFCQQCEAIFLNPKKDDQAKYENDSSKIRAYRERGLEPWQNAATNYMKAAPSGTRTVVDAACGAGQLLSVVKAKEPSLRVIGLELSRPAVSFMRDELGLESYVADLDNEDLDALIAPGSADYIIFNEAYEHVRTPTIVLKRLLRLLRPGGRIRFSAQAYGPEFALQIRVGEPIFVSAKTVDWTLAQTGSKLLELRVASKMYITLEKP
jgi:SAM-dependent methyltransferase